MSIKMKLVLCAFCVTGIIYAFGQTSVAVNTPNHLEVFAPSTSPAGIGLTYALDSTGCAYMSNTTATICGTPSGVFFATSTDPSNWQSVAVGTPGPKGDPGGTPASFTCDYKLSTVNGKQHISFDNCQ